MQTLSQEELVRRAAAASSLTQAETEEALHALTGAIAGAVAEGYAVRLPHLGTLEPKTRAARRARNPQTGESMTVPEKVVPNFKPTKAFATAVAG